MDINNSQSTWPAGSAPPFLETTPEASSAWEHSDECDPEVETWLTLTTATRDQAETARQKVAEEILEATREKCQELLLSGNNALQNAKRLEAEADTWHSEAQAELKQAESIRTMAGTDGRAVHQNAKRLEAEAEAKHAEAKAAPGPGRVHRSPCGSRPRTDSRRRPSSVPGYSGDSPHASGTRPHGVGAGVNGPQRPGMVGGPGDSNPGSRNPGETRGAADIHRRSPAQSMVARHPDAGR